MNLVLISWLFTCFLAVIAASDSPSAHDRGVETINQRSTIESVGSIDRRDAVESTEWEQSIDSTLNSTSDNTTSSNKTSHRIFGMITIPLVAAGVAAVVITTTIVVAGVTWYYWPQISYGLHTANNYTYCHFWTYCPSNDTNTTNWSMDVGDNVLVRPVANFIYCRLWTHCQDGYENGAWSVAISDHTYDTGHFLYCTLWVHCPLGENTNEMGWSLHLGEILHSGGHFVYCKVWAHCQYGNTTGYSLHVGELLHSGGHYVYCKVWAHCTVDEGFGRNETGWSLHVGELIHGAGHYAYCKVWEHCTVNEGSGNETGWSLHVGEIVHGTTNYLYCKVAHCNTTNSGNEWWHWHITDSVLGMGNYLYCKVANCGVMTGPGNEAGIDFTGPGNEAGIDFTGPGNAEGIDFTEPTVRPPQFVDPNQDIFGESEVGWGLPQTGFADGSGVEEQFTLESSQPEVIQTSSEMPNRVPSASGMEDIPNVGIRVRGRRARG